MGLAPLVAATAFAFVGVSPHHGLSRTRAPQLTSVLSEPIASRLLELVSATDRGVAVPSDAVRTEIDTMITSLEESWAGTDAFCKAQASNLLRRTEVAYVGQSSSVNANAAGGKYRGRIGRLLFRTDALFQHVLDREVAVNVIQFKLLGLVRGSAVLPGRWSRPSAAQLDSIREQANARWERQAAAGLVGQDAAPRALSPNTIFVQFDAPRLAFGRWLNLRFGPSSEVALDTTYLDDTLRICRGATSGTPFVFRSDTCADGMPLAAASQEWEDVMAVEPLGKRPVLAALVAAAVTTALLGRGLPSKVVAGGLAAAGVAIARSTGGIVVERKAKAPQEAAVVAEAVDALKKVVEEQEAAPLKGPSPEAAARWVASAEKQVKGQRSVEPSVEAPPTPAPPQAPNVAVDSAPEVVVAEAQPEPATRESSRASGDSWGPPPSGFEWGSLY